MPACSAVVSNGGYAGASRESRGGGGGIRGCLCGGFWVKRFVFCLWRDLWGRPHLVNGAGHLAAILEIGHSLFGECERPNL